MVYYGVIDESSVLSASKKAASIESKQHKRSIFQSSAIIIYMYLVGQQMETMDP